MQFFLDASSCTCSSATKFLTYHIQAIFYLIHKYQIHLRSLRGTFDTFYDRMLTQFNKIKKE